MRPEDTHASRSPESDTCNEKENMKTDRRSGESNPGLTQMTRLPNGLSDAGALQRAMPLH